MCPVLLWAQLLYVPMRIQQCEHGYLWPEVAIVFPLSTLHEFGVLSADVGSTWK